MRNTIIFVLALSGCFAETMPASGDDTGGESSGSEGGSQSSTTAGGSAGSSSTEGGSTDSSGSTTAQEETGVWEESSSGSSSESDVGESSTGEFHPPYQPCTENDTSLCAPDEICIYGQDVLLGDEIGWCAKPCQDGDAATDCPAAEDGEAVLTCTYYGELPLRCMLRCPNGETCPSGMTCHVEMYLPETMGTYYQICA